MLSWWGEVVGVLGGGGDWCVVWGVFVLVGL